MPYQRPGVFVSEESPFGVAQSRVTDQTAFIFMQRTYRGSSFTPTRVSSWNDFVDKFGGFRGRYQNYSLPFAVWQFFQNGGAECYIVRVVGTGGSTAEITIPDVAATPQSTLKVTAADEGLWGNELNITITHTSRVNPAKRFSLTVYEGDPSATVAARNVVENYTDLSMNEDDARYVVDVVNASSNCIVLENLDSGTAYPYNIPKEDTYTLEGGANGGNPGINQYTTAINSLGYLPAQSFVLNLPMGTTSTLSPNTNAILAAIDYAEEQGTGLVVVDPSYDLSVAQVITEQDLYGETSHAAVYYPWVYITDPVSSVPGTLRAVAPGGAVMGIMARNDRNVGAWKAPAGLSATVNQALSLATKLSTNDLDDLNASHVNAIRQHPVGGVVVFGARTLWEDSPLRYVPTRRNLNYVKDACRAIAEEYVYEENNPDTWARLSAQLSQFLTRYWRQGGLVGNSAQDAFFVRCDETNNNVATAASGELYAEVGVALSTPAEFVIIRIGQVGDTTAVEEGV